MLFTTSTTLVAAATFFIGLLYGTIQCGFLVLVETPFTAPPSQVCTLMASSAVAIYQLLGQIFDTMEVAEILELDLEPVSPFFIEQISMEPPIVGGQEMLFTFNEEETEEAFISSIVHLAPGLFALAWGAIVCALKRIRGRLSRMLSFIRDAFFGPPDQVPSQRVALAPRRAFKPRKEQSAASFKPRRAKSTISLKSLKAKSTTTIPESDSDQNSSPTNGIQLSAGALTSIKEVLSSSLEPIQSVFQNILGHTGSFYPESKQSISEKPTSKFDSRKTTSYRASKSLPKTIVKELACSLKPTRSTSVGFSLKNACDRAVSLSKYQSSINPSVAINEKTLSEESEYVFIQNQLSVVSMLSKNKRLSTTPFYVIETQPPDGLPTYQNDDLTLVRTLGKGSFGSVYLVQGYESRIYYAMKCVNKDLPTSTSIVEEADIICSLNSPFIIKHFATFQKADQNIMLIEPCSKGDLFSLQREQPKFRFDEAALKFFAANMVLALQVCHSSGILHRDIKQDNYLISDNGYLKMTDFGLSCRIDKLQYCIAGASAYMCPEMVQEVDPPGYSFPADFWSMGICLYFMCTAELPLPQQGSLVVEQESQYLATNHLELCFPSDFSQNGKDFISALLTRNPDDRIGGLSNPCKEHPWFSDMDWGSLENQTLPPPKCSGPQKPKRRPRYLESDDSSTDTE